LKSNGGCLILRINNLLSNPKAYYYLKKALLSGKVNLDYKRGYMEILSLNGLKPEPIKFNEKVILIGDYNTYNIMYNYDPDFKKVFKIKAEYKYIVDIDDYTKESF
jgi:predicted ATP-dependent protease